MRLLSIFVALAFFTLLGCKDECEGVNCNNNGTCIDGTCACDLGYDGADCETELRLGFIGDYEGPIDCGIILGNTDATLSISSEVSAADQISLDFDIDILDIAPVTATVSSEDNFTINTNMQSVEINGQQVEVTISGEGVLQSDNSISILLNTDPGFGVISCDAIFLRI